MDDEAAVRARLNAFVAEYVGQPHAAIDAQSVCIREGSAAVYIRLLEHDPRFVRIFSPMVHQVDEDYQLLTALNDINSTMSFGRVFWRDDTVFVSSEHLAATLDLDELVHACEVISDIADHHDDLLTARFGGHRNFEDEA